MTCRTAESVKGAIETMVKDFSVATNVPSVEGVNSCLQWMPPPNGWIKVNVDAAFCITTRSATLGMVARNEKSEVCYSAVTKSEDTDTPLLAEIKAILFGVQMAKEMGIRNIQLESDCLLAITELSKNDDSFCEWNSILMDIEAESLDYDICLFTHVSRIANALAHNIAKYHCELGDHRIWRNALPPLICNPDALST